MAFTIMTHMAQPGPDLFYTPEFRLMIETHINVLRYDNVSREQIPDNLVYQYEGDFYGYLVGKNVAPYLHWIYLRVNGMHSPSEFGKYLREPYRQYEPTYMLTPNEGVLSNIQRMYTSLKK